MQKGEMGFGGDVQIDGQSGALCGQESTMLETSSSFGSTSSSVSFSNLPPIKPSPLQENKTRFPLAESTATDIARVASAISYHRLELTKTRTFKLLQWKIMILSTLSESSDAKITDPVFEMQTHKTVQISGYPIKLDQVQRQQAKFVHVDTHFASQIPTGVFPVASYYPVYTSLPHQQHLQYLPHQPYPVYVMPVGQSQIYNSSAQYGSKDTSPVISGWPPLHPNSTVIPSQVSYKDVTPAPPVPEFTSRVYRTAPVANTIAHVPYS